MNNVDKQIDAIQKSLAHIFDEIAVNIVQGNTKKALDIALETKRELVTDCESQN